MKIEASAGLATPTADRPDDVGRGLEECTIDGQDLAM